MPTDDFAQAMRAFDLFTLKVPKRERVNRKFIEGCGGANPEHWNTAKDPKAAAAAWVEQKLSTLTKRDACAAAIHWGSSKKWKRCSQRVAPGDLFCFRHGGAHPPKPVYVKKSADPQWVIDRLQRRRQSWLRRRGEAAAAIAQLDAAIAKAVM